MLTFKDVAFTDGICWRFIDADAPDQRPNVNDINTPDNPKTWDWWDPIHYDKGYLEEYAHLRIELLEHFTTHSTPTLLKGTVEVEQYTVVRTQDLRAGQWFLGPYDALHYARKVTASLNAKQSKSKEYRRDFGPCGTLGYAIVRIETPACKTPPGLVIRSCVDPLDKLLRQRVDGMCGAICFQYYQEAQRTESLVKTHHGWVSTNADCGLNEGQVALAQEIWPLALRIRFIDAAYKERHRVVCDDVDELPNMAEG